MREHWEECPSVFKLLERKKKLGSFWLPSLAFMQRFFMLIIKNSLVRNDQLPFHHSRDCDDDLNNEVFIYKNPRIPYSSASQNSSSIIPYLIQYARFRTSNIDLSTL